MKKIAQQLGRRPIEGVICVLLLGFGVGITGFFDVHNFQNILSQLAPVLLLACGQAVVMISGGLDLSQGSLVGVSSVCFVLLARNFGIGAAALATVAIATGVGVVNAVVTKWVKNSFIATFSSMYVLMGAVIYATGGTAISEMPATVRGSLQWVGSDTMFALPAGFVLAVIAIGILGIFLHGSRPGLAIYAWGANTTAARVHGIREMPIQLVAFSLSAVYASLAGMLLSARVLQGNPQMGEGLIFESIAACVVGGVALTGGIGGIWMVFRGCLLVAIIQNGLYLN